MHRIVILLLVALPVVTVACTKPTEEDLIKKTLKKAFSDAEDGDVNGVLIHISDDFRGPNRSDKQTVRGILIREMMQGQRIAITHRNLEILVDPETMTAKLGFDALISRTSKAKVLPEDMGDWHFDLELKKHEKQWLIQTAQYQQLR